MTKERNTLGQFLKGLMPWNKNKKGIHLSPDTEFKSGEDHTGENHPSWNGGEQTPKNDCTHVWTGTNERVRKPRMIYQEAHGPIPAGHVIYHIDGNKRNDDPSNLEAISRGELMQRNANEARELKKDDDENN